MSVNIRPQDSWAECQSLSHLESVAPGTAPAWMGESSLMRLVLLQMGWRHNTLGHHHRLFISALCRSPCLRQHPFPSSTLEAALDLVGRVRLG